MSYKLFFFLLAMVAFESQPKMKSATSLQQPAWLGSDNRLTTPEFLWGLTRVQIEDKTADNQFLLISLTRTDLPRDSNFTHFFLQPTHAPGSAMKQVTLPANAQKPRFHPAGKHLFFLQNDTLYVLEIATNQIQKTSDFPINEYFISADGQTMVFTKSVKYFQSMREKYADLGKADAKLFKSLNYRHWDTWRDEFRQNIFVAPFHLGRKLAPGQNLMDGEPYDAQNISCSANGQMILYDAKKVTPNEQTLGTNTDVYLYDVNSNKTTNLSDGMLGYDQNAVFTPDGRGVAWNSMATAGYETDRNRIFFYELKTGRAQEITTGLDFNANKPQWVDDQTLLFSAEIRGTTQLFLINTNGKTTQLTHGAHTVDRFMHDGKRVFYTRSSFDKPAEIYQSGLTMPGEAQQLTFINEEALKTVRLSKFEERYCKTFDGKQLQSWVVFPPDFDPKKKYPVVLYCQGGPQSPMNSQWGTRWSMQLIAAQGFIVIAPNRRGTFGFGVEWTKTISKNWESGTKDLLAAIDDFSKEPFVDKNRMAAVGGSFGGYSVFWLAGHHNGRFKCFISHCGLFNLESFYLTTDELFFADYDMGASFWRATDNPTFTKFNPIKMVKNWNTPILIIQGGQDFRVPESEGFQAFQAAQLQGIKSQFLYFPTEGHWIKRPQNSVLWQREFMGWLNEHLH